mgnify:CR=1 FL=1
MVMKWLLLKQPQAKKRKNKNPAILCAPSTKQQFSDTYYLAKEEFLLICNYLQFC